MIAQKGLSGINHSLAKKYTERYVAKFLACNKKYVNFVVLAYKFCSVNYVLYANWFMFSKLFTQAKNFTKFPKML